ncbi:hypothetical protein Phou_052550 [Phytohabitans houttuyneae]|uniref:AMP-dependent synthetase/ligase domain-containing protein n=1 Tax=Phytohabitans houttuyneae TaxID=1076126 RepID=A0A6V8KK62_9ACTN|nr:hypothetical protein Phou_052550 [Phytohabitans houttuyneae]
MRRTPDALAVTHGESRWTYADLDRRAEAIAAALRGLGVRRETTVGVCLDRSPDLIAAFLAVLKAGGAYVPVDPEHPAPRRHDMLAQAGAPVVIAEAEWAPSVPRLDPRSVVDGLDGPVPLPPQGRRTRWRTSCSRPARPGGRRAWRSPTGACSGSSWTPTTSRCPPPTASR